MNAHSSPRSDAVPIVSPPRGVALVTASHAPDFERCRLLCDTVDRWAEGVDRHYILVAGHDLRQFRQLETSTRLVVDEREILPGWLHALPDPSSLLRRHFWLSTRTLPLRGWHVQQLRRIAIAAHADEEVLFYCDSDVAFVRPFDLAGVYGAGRVGLFRRTDGVGSDTPDTHRGWIADAGRVLGLPKKPDRMHDYVGTLIAWRRETVRDMCRHIEHLHGRHWAAAIAARRNFSECMIYGRYVDEVIDGKGHVPSELELCRVMWEGDRPDDARIGEFLATMSPHQVAVGIQSFIGVEPERLRRLILPSDD